MAKRSINDEKKEVIFEKTKKEAKLPKRQHPNDAGYDLFSAEKAKIDVDEVKAVRTGLKVKLPPNVEAQVRPRSGLSLSGVTVMNSPGTIDPGYRGEIKIILANLVGEEISIEKGDRIAQMIFAPITHPEIKEGSLDKAERGEGGFGSTGV